MHSFARTARQDDIVQDVSNIRIHSNRIHSVLPVQVFPSIKGETLRSARNRPPTPQFEKAAPRHPTLHYCKDSECHIAYRATTFLLVTGTSRMAARPRNLVALLGRA
eukprot:556862-Hanusia_phi.AAC.4